MRIMAISAYVPRDRYAAVQANHEPRRVVTVAPATPIDTGPTAAAMLFGRGMIVDMIC